MNLFGERQLSAMRFGAWMLLLAVPILLVVTFASARAATGEKQIIVTAEPGHSIVLPEVGAFGGSTIVYGDTAERIGSRELDCKLLDDAGKERGGIPLNDLAAVTKPAISVDGDEFVALFEASYARGDRIECADLSRVAPIAVLEPSTFGSAGALVAATSAGAAVTSLALGVGGLLVLRRAGAPDRAPRTHRRA